MRLLLSCMSTPPPDREELLVKVARLMCGWALESDMPPPACAKLLVKITFVRAGLAAEIYMPPPVSAPLLAKVRLRKVGLPKSTVKPPPWEGSETAEPSASPPMILKPSRMAVLSPPPRTTWYELSLVVPGSPILPLRMVTFTAGLR